MQVHPIATRGFGTGTNELYDRARPPYPADAIAKIAQSLQLAGHAAPFNVVEMGSGTGIFTRCLLRHPDFSKTISQLTAIEPSAGMRDFFAQSVQDERVTLREGTFESTDIPDGSAHLVIIAQAWHWCPDYDAGMREIDRILSANGVVAFIWNLEDGETASWAYKIRAIFEQHEKGTPQFRLELWRATFETETYQSRFQPQNECTFRHWIPTTRDQVLDRVHSKSYITQLSEEERSELDVVLEQALESQTDKTWVDQSAGIFQYPYKTTLVIMQKQHN